MWIDEFREMAKGYKSTVRVTSDSNRKYGVSMDARTVVRDWDALTTERDRYRDEMLKWQKTAINLSNALDRT